MKKYILFLFSFTFLLVGLIFSFKTVEAGVVSPGADGYTYTSFERKFYDCRGTGGEMPAAVGTICLIVRGGPSVHPVTGVTGVYFSVQATEIDIDPRTGMPLPCRKTETYGAGKQIGSLTYGEHSLGCGSYSFDTYNYPSGDPGYNGFTTKVGADGGPGVSIWYGPFDTPSGDGWNCSQIMWDTGDTVECVQRIAPAPTTGTINVSTNNAAVAWNFDTTSGGRSDGGTLCGASSDCAGLFQTYTVVPATYQIYRPYGSRGSATYSFKQEKDFIAKLVNSANAASTCDSANPDLCTVAAGGSVSWDIVQNYCTINIVRRFNGAISSSGPSYTVSGPSTYFVGNSTATLSSQPADPSGTLISLSADRLGQSVGGYNSDLFITPADAQTCYGDPSGSGSVTFYLDYKSKPVIQVR